MEQSKKRSRSIAKRLNAALEWRRFGKNVILCLLVCLALLVLWGLHAERAAGGGSFGPVRREVTVHEEIDPANGSLPDEVREETVKKTVMPGVTARAIEGRVRLISPRDLGRALTDFPGDFSRAVRELLGMYRGGEGYSDTFPFRDIVYRFELGEDGEVVKQSAAAPLGLLSWLFLAITVSGLLTALFRTFSGSRVIRRYLRPLDDMAAVAEQLSMEQHSVDGREVRAESTGAEQSREGLEEAIDEAIGEIDDVKDSAVRIEFHQTELEGLESALNNMLMRLEESKKKQMRFVDDASHELRTPIAVIHGYADMLDRWGKDDPGVLEEAVGAIKTESDHMRTLIDQLLFLARGEMDRHVLTREPLDAQALMDEIMVESGMLDEDHLFRMLSSPENGGAEGAEAREGEDGAPVPEPALPDEPLTISADPAMIKQSVRILRDNAVKYTPAGGEVTFKAYARTSEGENPVKQVCLEVGDTGIGIPPEELPRIFDRFYRGTNARGDNASGSGLGLSIAHWIVREHGGTIEAISSPGFGTRMTIVLPAA